MTTEPFDRWKNEYATQAAPAGFADRVMERIESADTEVINKPIDSKDTRSDWRAWLLRWSLVSAASLVACLRIVQVLWVFHG